AGPGRSLQTGLVVRCARNLAKNLKENLMRTLSRGMIAAALLLLAIEATPPLHAQVQWDVGDVFGAVGGGQYKVYRSRGGVRATRDTTMTEFSRPLFAQR